MTEMTYKIENGYVIDENNNRESVAVWGEDGAKRRLATLKDCSDCWGCSDCWDCSDCSDCSDCWGCSDCSDCSRCSGWFDAKPVSGCAAAKVPVIHDIHKAVYAAITVPGALDMRTWHSCETTHCRAGWVVTLAGEAGAELEEETSTLHAAMRIYEASGYLISPVRFFDSNERAMADMKRLAER